MTKTTRQLGTEPVVLNEALDGDDLLFQWADKHHRGMTLVYVGGYLPLAPVSEGRIENLQRAIQRGGSDLRAETDGVGTGNRLGNSDYLSAAVALGIVAKIYWVIPYPFFTTPGGGEQTRQFLIERGLVKDRIEAERLRFAAGCLTGPIHDVEVSVCAPETMYLIRDPVLLDLDVTFFTEFAASHGIGILETFKIFMDAMFSRDYSVAMASFGPSAAGASFDPVILYVGSQVQEALENPSIMRRTDAPPLWRARGRGEALLKDGGFREAYTKLTDSVSEFGPDEGLQALLATAAFELGRHDEALTIAGELCRRDDANCALLAYFGDQATERGLPDAARSFFAKAVELKPGWKPAQTRLHGNR